MPGVIDKMKSSKNKLLEAEAKGLDKWKKLKHTKADLELFLTYNIAEIQYKPKDANGFVKIVCTSNNRFIKTYSALKKKDKEKYQHSPFNGIKTRDTTSVMTYDLEEGTLKTVSLRAWEILNFITITEENVLVLDQLVRDCLKR